MRKAAEWFLYLNAVLALGVVVLAAIEVGIHYPIVAVIGVWMVLLFLSGAAVCD